MLSLQQARLSERRFAVQGGPRRGREHCLHAKGLWPVVLRAMHPLVKVRSKKARVLDIDAPLPFLISETAHRSGGGELKIATTVPGWVCYVCRESGIYRPNALANMVEFCKENNPDLLPPVDPNDPELHGGERTMPAARMRDFVKATSFTQQNLIITNAQKSNRQATLTKKNLSYYAESGIRVLSLFSGIEVALVAVKQLGIEIEKWCSCELEENARKLVQVRRRAF